MAALTFTTSSLIVDHVVRPLHLWGTEELRTVKVSSKSLWTDKKWILDGTTHGRDPSTTTINWELHLADGSLLTDPIHATALDYWRRLIWSLFTENASERNLSIGSAQGLNECIRNFVPWMIENGYQLPCQLDMRAINTYVDEVLNAKLEALKEETDEAEDTNISLTTGHRIVQLPIQMWRQRGVMAKAGFAPMPEEPFGGLTINAVASALGARANGWIKPLPDEVSVPILNKAAWFLGKPGEDVIALVEGSHHAYANPVVRRALKGEEPIRATREKAQRIFQSKFQFSTLEGEDGPWYQFSTDADEKAAQITHLVVSLRDACVITLMSQAGVRISETCGARGGIDPLTGWPTGVRIEMSITGLNEIFLWRTDLSKTCPTPERQDWVIGMRPKGSDEVPPAIVAMRLLQRLYAANRPTEDSTLLPALQGGGVPKVMTSKEISNNSLRVGMKNFVANWVDLSHLPDESRYKKEENDLVIWKETKGRCISTHMLRKTWAQFAIDVDPRLLPVISMQFKHLSLAMTELGYISKNPQQVDLVNSVKSYMAAQLLYELSRGQSRVAGKKGEELERDIAELRERIKDSPAAKAWRTCVRYCEENDLRIFFAPHGACTGSHTPLDMECHKLASTVSWRNKAPNFVTRSAQVCSGCSCYLISRQNIPFWSERYVESAVTVIQGERIGIAGQFTVVKKRRDQALSILKHIGAEITELDALVKSRTMESEYVST